MIPDTPPRTPVNILCLGLTDDSRLVRRAQTHLAQMRRNIEAGGDTLTTLFVDGHSESRIVEAVRAAALIVVFQSPGLMAACMTSAELMTLLNEKDTAHEGAVVLWPVRDSPRRAPPPFDATIATGETRPAATTDEEAMHFVHRVHLEYDRLVLIAQGRPAPPKPTDDRSFPLARTGSRGAARTNIELPTIDPRASFRAMVLVISAADDKTLVEEFAQRLKHPVVAPWSMLPGAHARALEGVAAIVMGVSADLWSDAAALPLYNAVYNAVRERADGGGWPEKLFRLHLRPCLWDSDPLMDMCVDLAPRTVLATAGESTITALDGAARRLEQGIASSQRTL